jgi:hypothetical protein
MGELERRRDSISVNMAIFHIGVMHAVAPLPQDTPEDNPRKEEFLSSEIYSWLL